MATIAKLDSNGVQVLPEGQRGKTTSPQVHSSTDLTLSNDGRHIPVIHAENILKQKRFSLCLL